MFDSLQFLPRSKLGRELEIKQKDLSVVRRAEDKSLEQLAGGSGDLVRKKTIKVVVRKMCIISYMACSFGWVVKLTN